MGDSDPAVLPQTHDNGHVNESETDKLLDLSDDQSSVAPNIADHNNDSSSQIADTEANLESGSTANLLPQVPGDSSPNVNS